MAMRPSPHVFLRPGELSQAEWCDIEVEETMVDPADRMKMRSAHLVPLWRQVLDTPEELRELTRYRQHLFPCSGKPRKAMSENAVNEGCAEQAIRPDR
jgi:integrase